MPRIRTIKPEFPQSESMGRVSRDARLLFIELWTLADDSGRLRGASRMLASLLFPYDDDAPGLIDGWLDELSAQNCIMCYKVDSQAYIQICNWSGHQKIDRPSASHFPEPEESSRILANPRESSSLDQGPRTKEGTKDAYQGSARVENGSENIESAYPRAILAEWQKLGDKVIQPPELHFLQTYGQAVKPHLSGLHSDDVLQAIRNFGTIIAAPAGVYYWTARIALPAFVQKHLEKFLPVNFSADDFFKRDRADDDMDVTRRRLAEMRAERAEKGES